MECLKKNGSPNFKSSHLIPYYEDRVAYLICSDGHKTAFVVPSLKFEVLMESGINALDEDFTLEACASFSTALERVYEFGLKVMLTHQNVKNTNYEIMFKEMARQSERQLGAFLAMYITEFKVPYKFNQEIPRFRNSIIHKGLIPCPEEAIDFCSIVYGEIFSIVNQLKSNFPEAFSKVIKLDMIERYENLDKDASTAGLSGSAFFNLNQENEQDFKNAHKLFKDQKEMLSKIISEFQKISE